MIELRTIKNFLSSFASVEGTHYQIWDNRPEMLFSTEDHLAGDRPPKEYHSLIDRIADRNDFQYTLYDGGHFLCGIPLRFSEDVTGVLLAYGKKNSRFLPDESGKHIDDDHADAMKLFFHNLIGMIEENVTVREDVNTLTQELEQSFEDLHLYGKISTQIKKLTFSDDMLHDMLKDLLDNMQVESVFTWFVGAWKHRFQMINAQGCEKFLNPDPCVEDLIRLIPSDPAALKSDYFILNNSQENAQYQALATVPYRFLSIKIEYQKDFYGWLGLLSYDLSKIFRRGELKICQSLAEQLAAVLANSDLYDDLEQFVINMVRSLVFAIEAKDVYTRGHSERVSRYSILMGKQLDLEEAEQNNVKWASILHDIGKIGIPEKILNKPGRLTTAEYEIIKKHPEKGCEILHPIEQLADSIPGIRHHHERFDGKGYPAGLKGEAIPLVARIIAVADLFDAVNSTRAYRGARGPELALAKVVEVAGSQLDPRIVDVFKKVYNENFKINKEGKICPIV